MHTHHTKDSLLILMVYYDCVRCHHWAKGTQDFSVLFLQLPVNQKLCQNEVKNEI